MFKNRIGLIVPLLSISFLLNACYKPIYKNDTNEQEKKDDLGNKGENNTNDNLTSKIKEYDPLIKSDEYHLGYEKRKYNSLFPYEPTITYEMPRIDITTDNEDNSFAINSYSKPTPWFDANFSVSNCNEKYIMSNMPIKIKQRGNTSLYIEKKQFNISFEEKVGILGLNNGNKYKKWVLNAMGLDVSSLRDKIAYYLGKQMFNNINLYTTDSIFTEVYINNTYWGMYLLIEKQQVNKKRVDIDDVEKREPKGNYKGTDIGYFIEYDGFAPQQNEEPYFRIDYHDDGILTAYNKSKIYHVRERYSNWGPQNYFTIHSDIYDQRQIDFIANYVDKVYDIMYDAIYNKRYYEFNEDYTDIVEVTNTTSYETINKVINIDSFVNMFIFQEIVLDQDLGFTSKYMSVDFSTKGDKKLAWNALWDYDFCFGNEGALFGMQYTLYVGNGLFRPNGWLINLVNEKWFMDMVKKRWKELVDGGVLYNSLHYIDEFSITYKKQFSNNYDKWSYIPLNYVRVHYTVKNSATDHTGAKNFLFEWLAKRYNSLNKIIGDYTKLFTY